VLRYAVEKRRQQGTISLRDLYSFARKHGECAEEAIRLEENLGREYCALCASLTNEVDDDQGFYLWGVFDRKRYWHSIYLGKAGFGRASSLKKRIWEELKDERAFLWRAFLDKRRLFQIRDTIHPHGRYTWSRPVLKTGTTHILWTSAPSVGDIAPIEADLIEALDPFANIQRKAPAPNVQREATEIFERFRRLIHGARHEARILTLSQEKDVLKRLAQ
jgi:hypothetical protein